MMASSSINHQAVAHMVVELFDQWDLSPEDRLALLGLSPSDHSVLNGYLYNNLIEDDQYVRITHLLAIHKNLRILFPRNKEQMYSWMNVKNNAFENLSPLDVVKEFGLEGLIRVNSYLDSQMSK
jgi:hypothetical protein